MPSPPFSVPTSVEALKQYKIAEAPNSIYYVPNYISEAEEKELLRRIDASPIPKWTTLSNRRLQNWGGFPHPKGMIAEPLPDWLQPYCARISDMGVFDADGVERRANHVLVNEYLSGQGILPHEDGPLYFPTVTTISLGSHTMLDFYRKADGDNVDEGANVDACHEGGTALERPYLTSVYVEPRSLLIVQDAAYTNCLHGIKEVTHDVITDSVCNWSEKMGTSDGDVLRRGEILERGRRVSLTIRHVPKTIKSKILFRRK